MVQKRHVPMHHRRTKCVQNAQESTGRLTVVEEMKDQDIDIDDEGNMNRRT